MESNDEIKISVLKGDKLFNENTPFAINISSPDRDPDIITKKCNTDLICVIDSSSSMRGNKIYQVKESLKILIDLMDKNDRLSLILFNSFATNYFDLQYLTDNNKKMLKDKIDLITTYPGTNILSGLEIAVDIIKKENLEKKNEERVTSIILLSDGYDSYNNEERLANSLKNMTKGLNLLFTLHTFGYGRKYDEKILTKLASLRDGSFYYVENYSNVTEYFACVLGGCISVISQRAELNIKLLNNKCKIVKIFGLENLFEQELKDDFFKTTILQMISGKEYTFVFEVNINENNIKIGDELLDINFMYKDINNNNNVVFKNIKYKYELKSIDYLKANEEYIRSHVYSVLDEIMKLKEKGEKNKAKELLNEIKIWIKKNYKGNNKDLLIDVEKSYDLFEDNNDIVNTSAKYLSSQIRQNQFKKDGNNKEFCNSIQNNLMKSISNPIQFSSKFKIGSVKIPRNTNSLAKSINFGNHIKHNFNFNEQNK